MDAAGQLRDASADVDKLHDQLYSAIDRLSHLSSDETWAAVSLFVYRIVAVTRPTLS